MKSMKSVRSSETKRSFKAGELVRLKKNMVSFIDMYYRGHTIGVVLSDHPMEQGEYSPNDALVHILFADGKDIWTPHVFLERFGNE